MFLLSSFRNSFFTKETFVRLSDQTQNFRAGKSHTEFPILYLLDSKHAEACIWDKGLKNLQGIAL